MSDSERNGICLVSAFSLSARSLDIPTTDHPNKMPFSGILTYLDEPSDAPPGGSSGERIMITSAAATQEVLDSLLGMAVDYTPDLDDHDPQLKIGVITGSELVEKSGRKAIFVKGFIYAADFPEAAKEIKARKDELGMSFEARNLWTTDPKANPIPIHDLVFTGAAILLKSKAAYKTTSISAAAAASSTSKEDFIMDEKTKNELAEMLAAALKPVTDAVAAQNDKIAELEKLPQSIAQVQAKNHLDKVEPHAKRLEDAADKMDEAGIGGHSNRGHAAILRKMAGSMRAEAAEGKLPHVFYHFDAAAASADEKKVDVEGAVKAAVSEVSAAFDKKLEELKSGAEKVQKELSDKLAAAETKLADIKAKATEESPSPERKTLSREHGLLLAKTGLEPGENGKFDMAKLDTVMASIGAFRKPETRIEFKTALHNAGLID